MVSVVAPSPDPVSLDALIQVSPGDLTDDLLGEHLVALHRAAALVEAAKVRAMGVL